MIKITNILFHNAKHITSGSRQHCTFFSLRIIKFILIYNVYSKVTVLILLLEIQNPYSRMSSYRQDFNKLTFDIRTHIPVWGWGFPRFDLAVYSDLWPLSLTQSPDGTPAISNDLLIVEEEERQWRHHGPRWKVNTTCVALQLVNTLLTVIRSWLSRDTHSHKASNKQDHGLSTLQKGACWGYLIQWLNLRFLRFRGGMQWIFF